MGRGLGGNHQQLLPYRLTNQNACLQLGSLCWRTNWLADVFVSRGEPGCKVLVGQPSEEVVVLRSQAAVLICRVREAGSRSLSEMQSGRDVRIRASVQLESGSFLITQLSKGLITSPHRATPYNLGRHHHCC